MKTKPYLLLILSIFTLMACQEKAEMPPEIAEVVNQQIQEASQNIIQSAIMQQQMIEEQ